MLYKEYASRFWEVHRYCCPSVHELSLYFYLLEVWDKNGRPDTFVCEPKQIEMAIGLSKQTLSKCRERLQEKGLVGHEKGDRRIKKPYYFLIPLTKTLTKTLTNKTNPVKVSPTPPSKDNINNNKENNSNELLKKASLPSTTRKKKEEVVDYSSLANYFNDLLSPWLPRIQKIDGQRRVAVDARAKEHGKEKIVEALNLVSKSDFLTGRKEGSEWKCSFDWIFKKSNFQKILEGNYNNGASNNKIGGQYSTDPGAVQEQPINIYKEVFGYDGPPDKFEEWFNRNPYGG